MSRRRGRKSKPAAAPRPPWLYAVVVALAAVAVYLPSLSNGFVNFDDDRNFLLNPNFRGFSAESLAWMSTTFQLGHYHPLTWFSLAADYLVWELDPTGYHLTNALLHALSTALVFFLGRRLLTMALPSAAERQILLGSAAAALLFGLHPLRVESVAWASERRDVLSGVFYFATILLYLRGQKIASYTTFACALLSKILTASLPVALLLIDLYPRRRTLTWRLLAEKAPYFALSLAAGLYTVTRFESESASGTFADLDVSPLLRLTLSLFALAFYLWKTLLPVGLAPQYVHTTDPTPLTPVFAVGAVAFVALAIVAWIYRKRCPALGIALAIYTATLLPVLSFLRLDPQQYAADHHTYLAVWGLCLLAGGWLAHRGFSRNEKLAAGGLVLLLAALTIRQAGFWSDSESLWRRTLTVSPDSVVAHNNLGRTLAAQGRTGPAERHFQNALSILPGYYHARYNLANLQMGQGQLRDAEGNLRRVVSAAPTFVQARGDLANCLLRQERLDEAEAEYQKTLETDPNFADAHFNYALLLEFQGRSAEARQHYAEALRLDPANTAARQRLQAL